MFFLKDIHSSFIHNSQNHLQENRSRNCSKSLTTQKKGKKGTNYCHNMGKRQKQYAEREGPYTNIRFQLCEVLGQTDTNNLCWKKTELWLPLGHVGWALTGKWCEGTLGWWKCSVSFFRITALLFFNRRKWLNLITSICMGTLCTWESQDLTDMRGSEAERETGTEDLLRQGWGNAP